MAPRARGVPVMAVVKAAVDLATLSETSIALALAHYGLQLSTMPTAVQKLHNGYSGCNYRVEVVQESGELEVLLLKGSVDKPPSELAVQVELLRHLEAEGFPTAAAVPPADHAAPWVIKVPAGDEQKGSSNTSLSVFLMRFVGGQPANLVMGSGAVGESEVLATAGATLARLHLMPLPTGFRNYSSGVGTKDGMFNPDTLAAFRAMSDERVATHPFLDFFERRISALSELVGVDGGTECSSQLEQGLMHCDFFLDNILVHEPGRPDVRGDGRSACELSALIDWEDAAAGPLVHDLGIGILGCCYDTEERLSAARVTAMLSAYNQIRPLAPMERQLLRSSVLGAALAVGFFRWRQFNVRHPEIVEVSHPSALPEFSPLRLLPLFRGVGPSLQAKDAYMEMVRKIEALENDTGDAATTLAEALAALGTVPTQRSAHAGQAL